VDSLDLFILAAEPSADLHGASLIHQLLAQNPRLKIGAVAGPTMRSLPIQTLFPMESLQVMGFLDVARALPRIARQFFAIRDTLLQLNPKAIICIDYPGFNLRLQRSLRKHHYIGKLIHYICPTVWAWGKKRIQLMANNLDLLLTLFPFEAAHFAHTPLPVTYVGHPLTSQIPPPALSSRPPLLALFPGSRETEIARNLPLQLRVAQAIQREDPTLTFVISAAPGREAQIKRLTSAPLVSPSERYTLMRTSRLALATSGTVTLELALHNTPTLVTYAIRPLDLFIARRIFRINLPFYCLVNIIASKLIFPEFFGPNLTESALLTHTRALWFDPQERAAISDACVELRTQLGHTHASEEAARAILQLV